MLPLQKLSHILLAARSMIHGKLRGAMLDGYGAKWMGDDPEIQEVVDHANTGNSVEAMVEEIIYEMEEEEEGEEPYLQEVTRYVTVDTVPFIFHGGLQEFRACPAGFFAVDGNGIDWNIPERSGMHCFCFRELWMKSYSGKTMPKLEKPQRAHTFPNSVCLWLVWGPPP